MEQRIVVIKVACSHNLKNVDAETLVDSTMVTLRPLGYRKPSLVWHSLCQALKMLILVYVVLSSLFCCQGIPRFYV